MFLKARKGLFRNVMLSGCTLDWLHTPVSNYTKRQVDPGKVRYGEGLGVLG